MKEVEMKTIFLHKIMIRNIPEIIINAIYQIILKINKINISSFYAEIRNI